MSDEGRPLPQRERGATEAGARPGASSAGPRELTDDLRQRMQAAVDAERAQARERVTDMLRQPPRRRATGVPLSPPSTDAQDPAEPGPARKPHVKRRRPAHSDPADKPGRRGRFERRGRADRPASPGVPATSGPNVIVPGVNGAPPVDSAPAETVSGNAAEANVLDVNVTDAGAPGVGAPNAPLTGAHPSGAARPGPGSPSAIGQALTAGAARATAAGPTVEATPAPAAPATPGPDPAAPIPDLAAPPGAPAPSAHGSPSPPRRRRGRAGLIAGVVAVVAAGAVVAILLTSGSGAPQPTGSSSGTAAPAAEAAAVKWVVNQVNPQTTVACDQATCAALVTHGYSPANLRKITSNSELSGSGIVVVTPTAREMFGSSLGTAWAPAALATFGTGGSEVSVRIVAPAGPNGAAKWERRARQDQAAREASEAALVQAKTITVSGPAQQDLQAGRVDGRLVEAIADAASTGPIDIVEFGNAGLGASPVVPLRYADLAVSNPAATLGPQAYIQALRTGMNTGPGPRPDRTEILTLPGGQKVLRVEFLAPSPFGVLTNP